MLHRARSVFRNLFQRSTVEQRIDTELEAYAELLAAEHRQAGVPPDEARRRALLEMGGVQQVKEQVQDIRAGVGVELLLQELRMAIRGLRRSPSFTITTIVTFALGLGAAVVVLAITDAVLVRPLPYRDARELVTVLQKGTDPVSPGAYLEWKRASSTLTALEAAEYWTPTFTDGGDTEQVDGLHVTPGMMEMLGTPPALGHGFTPHMDGARELLISDALWRRRYGADPSIIGRPVRVGEDIYVIVGVMGRGFQFAPFWATRAQVWAPLRLGGKSADMGGSSLRLFGRLRTGASVETAQREMDLITGRLAGTAPESNRDIRITALRDKAIGNARPALLALLGAVAFVLLITWVNVAHMMLARAYARERELSLRVALGADRLRVVREALTESFLLAALGALLATGVAGALLQVIASRGPFDLPQLATLHLDGRVAVLAAVLMLATSLIVAVLPALLANRHASTPTLRHSTRGAAAGGRTRLRQVLIASQTAFAIVLLVGTSLMVRTFVAMRAIDPGFDADGLMTMKVPLPRSRATSPRERISYFTQLADSVRETPGVSAVGFINHLPLSGDEWGVRVFGGATENATESTAPRSIYRVITPGLLATMGIQLGAGHDVGVTDDLSHEGVVIINRRLARMLWAGGPAVGRRLTFVAPGGERTWRVVIGVAEDVKQSQWTAAPDPEVYIPYSQARSYLESTDHGTGYLTLVARTSGDPTALVSRVRTIAQAADPLGAVTQIQSMSDVVGRMTARARFLMSVMIGFAALSLMLAAVGIYGLMTYAVTQRRQEIGIRIALGATAQSIVQSVLAQSAVVSGLGMLTGGIGAFGLTRFVEAQLYGVPATDPLSFMASAGLLSAVAIVASVGPALMVLRIDPLRAIRSD